jgi:hypothetical protein
MAREHLGDIEINDSFFQRLTDVTEHFDAISKVPRGHYTVYADVDAGSLILERITID